MDNKGYATYEFYKTTYYGDSLQEDDFEKWIMRAGRKLDEITSGRLQHAYPEDGYADMQVKFCACDIAEKMYEVDKYLKASSINENGTSSIVKSQSAGNESITFATGETVYASVIKDPRSLSGFYHMTAAQYLVDVTDNTGVCLLYRGV